MKLIELHEANGGRPSMHDPSTFKNVLELEYARLVIIKTSDDSTMALKVSETYEFLTKAWLGDNGTVGSEVQS